MLLQELTSFVGRDQELAEIRRLLAQSRLLTLTGPGGVGKTRLALRAAKDLTAGFADGLCLIRLDSLRDPELLPQTVADGLGLRGSSADPTEQVLGFVQHKELLLVLDNCEHLVDASAAFAETLLAWAPGVRILVTSRHNLGVSGEQLFPVQPLQVHEPSPAGADNRADAVALFEERARAVLPDFVVTEGNRELVTQICRWLDGIPLVIELAVVWLRVLTLEELRARLSDRFRLLTKGSKTNPSRQRTLTAAVEWSRSLCSPAEALLWARLSVFAGGFTLQAAEEICLGPGEDRTGLLAVLSELVDKSILVSDGGQTGRYHFLETYREFGLHELGQTGELQRFRRRHCAYVVAATGRMAQDWLGPDQPDLAERTQREHANIWAALEFALDDGDPVTAARLVINLEYHWVNCGCLTEGVVWVERVLDTADLPDELRFHVLWAQCFYRSCLGETRKDAATEVLAMARALGNPVLLGKALFAVADAAFVQGDYSTAEAAYARSAEAYASVGHVDWLVAFTHTARGIAAAVDHKPEVVTAAKPEVGFRDQVLTRRETQVAALVTEGETNKAIATRLRISRRTVEVHVDHILTKLELTSRTQIALWTVNQRRKPA